MTSKYSRSRRMLVAGFATLAVGLAPLTLHARGSTPGGELLTLDQAAQAPEPREVQVALYLADLIDVDGPAQSFQADVLLSATWHDSGLVDDSGGFRTLGLEDVWHPSLMIVNLRNASPTLPEEVQVAPDGTVSYVQRYTGDFGAHLDLRQFPLDRQLLNVWVVAPPRAPYQVRLVADPREEILVGDQISISDWAVGEAKIAPEAYRTTPRGTSISGIALELEIERKVNYYVIQVVIPLAAIVMMVWSVFWVAPTVVTTRVGVVVTTMLTLIAYRFMLAAHVPRLPYLTRMDWFMLGATVLVLLVLFIMAGCAYLIDRGHEATVKKIDRIGRVLYPILFGAYVVLVWVW